VKKPSKSFRHFLCGPLRSCGRDCHTPKHIIASGNGIRLKTAARTHDGTPKLLGRMAGTHLGAPERAGCFEDCLGLRPRSRGFWAGFAALRRNDARWAVVDYKADHR